MGKIVIRTNTNVDDFVIDLSDYDLFRDNYIIKNSDFNIFTLNKRNASLRQNKMEMLQSQASSERELLGSSVVRKFEFGNWSFDLRILTQQRSRSNLSTHC